MALSESARLLAQTVLAHCHGFQKFICMMQTMRQIPINVAYRKHVQPQNMPASSPASGAPSPDLKRDNSSNDLGRIYSELAESARQPFRGRPGPLDKTAMPGNICRAAGLTGACADMEALIGTYSKGKFSRVTSN